MGLRMNNSEAFFFRGNFIFYYEKNKGRQSGM